MKKSEYESSQTFAHKMDEADPLKGYRDQFCYPLAQGGQEWIYLAGNSLGLQPKKAREYINQELDDWARLAVEGHFQAKNPWLPYHELLTEQTARLVGAKPIEVVVMNTLSVNLHLMMVSFYQPTPNRFKILIEGGAFPSDQYAVASQANYHGYEPKEAVLELIPRPGESILRTEDILARIEREGEEIALVMIGSVNYLTGQAFDIESITRVAHAKGCRVGFDLAHGAGNLELKLHEWGPDFAVWCSYKYLNAGPGALSGCFVHERHALSSKLPRFSGWWGHDKQTRFRMESTFKPIEGAEGWQLSNPPIFQLAALRASMEIFDQASIAAIRTKAVKITGYLEFLLGEMSGNRFEIITPSHPEDRGTQLSLRFKDRPKEALERLTQAEVICDFREPNIIRVAPVPLYTRYSDIYRFVEVLAQNA